MALVSAVSIPALPPKLSAEATDDAQAVRAAQLQARRKAQKKAHEQQRDRSTRERLQIDSARRAALRLFNAARRVRLPQVDESTHRQLRSLTKLFLAASPQNRRPAVKRLSAAWEHVLQRKRPAKAQFFVDSDDSDGEVSMGVYGDDC